MRNGQEVTGCNEHSLHAGSLKYATVYKAVCELG
jgi:hypothetical protein